MAAKRIGPRMQAAVEYVGFLGGAAPSQLFVAEAVGPNGSRNYGYQIVGRCISAGLLTIDATHPVASVHGSGAVVLTDAGRALAAHASEA